MPKRAARTAVVLAGIASLSFAGPRRAEASDGDSIYAVDPIIDGAVIGGSALLVVSLYTFAAGAIDTRCPCDPQEVNSFDRFAVNYHNDAAAWASDVTAGVAFLAPVALDWLALGQVRPFVEDLTVYAEAIALSAAAVTVAKQLAQRPFPRTYQGDPNLVNSPNGYRSFYSGHTGLVFAALSTASVTYGERYGFSWVPWAITLAVGASIAIERVAAGWHFPTDVITGALAGTAIGIAVPVVHLRRLRLLPFTSAGPDGPGAGLMLAGRWR